MRTSKTEMFFSFSTYPSTGVGGRKTSEEHFCFANERRTNGGSAMCHEAHGAGGVRTERPEARIGVTTESERTGGLEILRTRRGRLVGL